MEILMSHPRNPDADPEKFLPGRSPNRKILRNV